MVKTLQGAQLGTLWPLGQPVFYYEGCAGASSECRTPSPANSWATALGYLGNYSFRRGRVNSSGTALAHKTTINAGYVLATALTERIFDALALVVISFAALNDERCTENLIIATRTMAAVGLLGTLGVLVAPRLKELWKLSWVCCVCQRRFTAGCGRWPHNSCWECVLANTPGLRWASQP
jgi:hypothetical protein